jgi:hypothetical protein
MRDLFQDVAASDSKASTVLVRLIETTTYSAKPKEGETHN